MDCCECSAIYSEMLYFTLYFKMLESIRNINGISKGKLYDWNYFAVKTFSQL